MPTPKVDEKLLKKLEKWLSQKTPRTVEEMADKFDTSIRTVYRYLSLLRENGVEVRRVDWGRPTRFRIEKSPN